MTLIDRYLTREILKYLFLVLLVAATVYMVVDFFEKVDNLIEAEFSVGRMLVFFLLRAPQVFAQIIPAGILLSVIIFLGLMQRNNEIIAMLSGGISKLYPLRSILSIGVALSLTLFFLSEVFIPLTANKANRIWVEEVRKRSALVMMERDVWIKGDRSILRVRFYDPSKQRISGFTGNFFDDDFRLIRRVDAEALSFQGRHWQLENALVRAIKEVYAEKIESLIEDAVEKTVQQEIDKLQKLVSGEDE